MPSRVRNPVHAERGDVNSCGDWLAVALKEAFRTDDGGFDLTAFKACLKENDTVEFGKSIQRDVRVMYYFYARRLLRRNAHCLVPKDTNFSVEYTDRLLSIFVSAKAARKNKGHDPSVA